MSAAAETALVIIACPNCGTRYQVAYSAIGKRGRSVQCAHCGKSWEAHADPPPEPPAATPPAPKEPVVVDLPSPAKAEAVAEKSLGALAEEMLDIKFVQEERKHRSKRDAAAKAAEEAEAEKSRAAAERVVALDAAERDEARAKLRKRAAARGDSPAPDSSPEDEEREAGYRRTVEDIKAAIAPRPRAKAAVRSDPAAEHRQQLRAFSDRQRSIASRLPLARFRRAARIGVLAAMIALAAIGLLGRTLIVQQFPQLAGAYAAIGLGVNVIGLEFREVRTLQSLQQGVEVLEVDGKIASVSGQPVNVPQVVVTLLGKDGAPLYEWSMMPKIAVLAPGESELLQTQLSRPPVGAGKVRLAFATGRSAPSAADGAAGDDGAPVPVVLGAPHGADGSAAMHGPR